MEKNKEHIDFITRHSLKEEQLGDVDKKKEIYLGLSPKGVELAKERAKVLIKLVEELQKKSVVWLGGCSLIPRNSSTLEIYAKEIKKYFSDKEEIIFLEYPRGELNRIKEAIEKIKKQKEELKKISENTSDKKIVIYFPWPILLTRELYIDSKKGTWDNPLKEIDENLKEDDGNKKDNEIMKAWFQQFSDREKDQYDPKKSPQYAANSFSKKLSFTKDLIKEYFPNRNTMFVSVGHSTELNPFITGLISEGKIDKETYQDKLNEFPVTETEQIIISEFKENKEVIFRNKKYKIN